MTRLVAGVHVRAPLACPELRKGADDELPLDFDRRAYTEFRGMSDSAGVELFLRQHEMTPSGRAFQWRVERARVSIRHVGITGAGRLLVPEPRFESWGRKLHWKRLFFWLALVGSLAFLSSCGSSSSSSTTSPPSVTVSCAPTQVTVLGSSQCTPNVLNLSSTLVNWSVSGTGTGPFGSIDSTGKYTAPSAVPTNNVVTITATSQADSTTKGTASITIEQPTQISAVTCGDPATPTQPASKVQSGNQLVCSATTSTGATVPVNWTVSNTLGGDIGSISTQGIYTAPLVPPPGQTVTITATSQAVSTQTMSVTATVIFGEKVLSGPYVFSTSGRVTNTSNAFFARVGSLTAGGGSLSGGFEDKNQTGEPAGPSGTTVGTTQIPFTGSYSVGDDGRGTMQFCENTGALCPPGSLAATAFFSIVVVSPQQVQIVDFSSSTTSAGEMISQDPSVFGAGTQNLSGAYSFSFAGVSSAGAEESVIGDFSANGFGTNGTSTINAGSNSPAVPGEMDVNGTLQTLSRSTYSFTSIGRGQVTLNGSTPLTFGFYSVSAGRAKFIEIDPAPSSILVGDAYKQQTGVNCGWGLPALSGTLVFETSGTTGSGSSATKIADVGSFSATNNGTTGSVSSASIDENSGGTVSSQSPPSGSYTVDQSPQPQPGCGRGTLSIGSHNYVFYIVSGSSVVLQETTSGVVAHGLVVQAPAGASFANTSLNGSYALQLSGTNAAGAAGQREDIAGRLTADGAGKVTSGSLDINSFGATQKGVAVSGAYAPSPAGSLRATMGPLTSTPAVTLPQRLVLYLVSPSQFYVLDTDVTGTAIGTLYNQF